MEREWRPRVQTETNEKWSWNVSSSASWDSASSARA